MKKLFIPAIIGLTTFTACNSNSGNNNAQFLGTWVAASIESPTQDSLFAEQLKEVEAWTEAPKELVQQLNTNNLDSIKAFVKSYLDEQKQQDEALIGKLKLAFNADGTVIRTIDGEQGSDTSMYYVNTTNGRTVVIFDPFVPGKTNINPQAVMMSGFEVDYAGTDSMRLKIIQPAEYKNYISIKKSK